jgi:NADH-quinone oxidoreductase subunit N
MFEVSNFIVDTQKSLALFLPEIILVITLGIAIFADIIFKKSRFLNGYIAIAGFILSGIILFSQKTNQFAFLNSFVVDSFAIYFKVLILLTNIIVILMSFKSKELIAENRSLGEFYTFLIGMSFGMFLLTGATNLILIYLAIETMSISSYILAGYTKEIKRASEASLKYVIFGAVSSGLMIYGISLIYGLTGSLNLRDINTLLQTNQIETFPLLISSLLIIAGFTYKISAVPFHFWTPDVYEGAPITITAYLSVASKAAGFAALIRFFKTMLFANTSEYNYIWTMVSNIDWGYIIAIISVLTMTLGNIVAIWQNNLKRLLAYSSIAHAGYLLMGVAVMSDIGVASVLLYFLFYLLMNLGAFYCVMLAANEIGSEDIHDFEGFGYRSPVIAITFSIFLFSLVGLPPTAGFIGKFYVFSAVIDAGMIWLAVIGAINSVISLYYYVKIMRNMFIRGIDVKKEPINPSFTGISIVIILAFLTILFGIYFSPILNWTNASAYIFVGN